jgi:hypothetical protein
VKVGDLVRECRSGQIGLVIDKFRRTESDGNPNGDFTVYHVHMVLFNDGKRMIRNQQSVEVISESR